MLATLVALRLCALSHVLLFVAALLASRATPSARLWGSTFGLCTACYLALPLVRRVGVDGASLAPLVALTHLPALFFPLFLHALYEDRPLPRPVAPAALAVAALAFLAPPLAERSLLPLVALQLLKILCVAAALLVVLRGRDGDLVDARRASRSLVAAAIALLMGLIVIAELAGGFRVGTILELVGIGAILALAFLINLALMRFDGWLEAGGAAANEGEGRNIGTGPGTLAGETARSGLPTTAAGTIPHSVRIAAAEAEGDSGPMRTEPAADASVALAERARAAMREERLYADHDLRVATLAAHLDVPEYRLRRAINGTLGHRNFNQFVNGYRLDEAAGRLATDPRTPVLTIALDVGFRSISSFNAAFRERYGRAPGAYRLERGAGIAK